MKSSDIPHDHIRQVEDRSWSLRLLDLIKNGPYDDYDEVVRTLQVLDDFRVIEPLLLLTEDASQEPWRRLLASRVVSSCATWETRERRASWWHSGDEILLRQAIQFRRKSDAELLLPIAANPDHPLYIDAIGSMISGYDESRFMCLRLNALEHEDPDVRAVAADALIYDEPVRATDRLVHMLRYDEDEPAQNALGTLRYYAQRKVLLALADVKANCEGEWLEDIDSAIQEIVDAFESVAQQLRDSSARAFELILPWLQPVVHLLDLDKREHESHHPRVERVIEPVSVHDVRQYFDDLDGPKSDRWSLVGRINESNWSETEQSAALQYFRNHPDWLVPDSVCSTVSKWESGARFLFDHLDHPVHSVRKSAGYWIRECPPEPAIAKRLLSELTEGSLGYIHAYEVLQSYASHAGNTPKVNQVVEEFALNDPREVIRYHAIQILCERQQRDAVSRLTCLLAQEPQSNWSVHTTLLSACTKLDIDAPEARGLADVDELFVQKELAEYLSR